VLAIETSIRGAHLSLREVKALLQEKLPAVMVPHLVLPLLSLPVTTAGKVDRQALRRQVLSTHFEEEEGPTRRESELASETALRGQGDGFDRARQAVCEVFLQVLPLTKSTRRSLESISGMPTIQTSPVLELDFFAAGGDSMTAVVLGSLLYRLYFTLIIDCLYQEALWLLKGRLGVDSLPVSWLRDNIQDLASRIAAVLGASHFAFLLFFCNPLNLRYMTRHRWGRKEGRDGCQ
jgi:hypothetical protein